MEKENKLKDFRQGEVRLKEVRDIPVGAKVSKGEYILAVGKSNLHKHVLKGKFLIKEFGGKKYVVVLGKASLIHEEHRAIKLPKGNYLVQIQREYVPRKEARLVED